MERIIAKSHFDAHTDPIFKNIGILEFHDIHLLHLGLIMYFHQNQTLPSKFTCKFTLRMVPAFVAVHTFCASQARDIQIS